MQLKSHLLLQKMTKDGEHNVSCAMRTACSVINIFMKRKRHDDKINMLPNMNIILWMIVFPKKVFHQVAQSADWKIISHHQKIPSFWRILKLKIHQKEIENILSNQIKSVGKHRASKKKKIFKPLIRTIQGKSLGVSSYNSTNFKPLLGWHIGKGRRIQP